ncbi:uncharacterized protein [Triticum aestivum]|uniref:uncharacterized protein n=1 Tax=Triticum aestivum TaxID=4565 RepID=UPI001D00E2B1|nr:uncharacterized protein LOC123079976 [Triticum aestivum]
MEEEGAATRFLHDDEDCLEEYDNVKESAIFGSSLTPPALPGLSDGNRRADPHPPSWVLLDVSAYIAGGDDDAADTTARSRTRGGHAIEATMIAARSPLGPGADVLKIHVRVHCPGLKPTRFATEPRIFAAADGLFLLGVVIGHRSLCTQPDMFDYFVYQPAARWLTLLPHPDGRFGLRDVTLLRCSPNSSSYIIAFLEGTRGMAYELHRFHSKSSTWTMNKLELAPTAINPALDSVFFCTSKVFTLGGGDGGGFVGWADLWRGVLLCDVLLDDPELRYIPLPHPFRERKWDAVITRDIAVVGQGCIKYVDKRSDEHSVGGWTVTAWSKKIVSRQPWKEEPWRQDYELRSSDVSVLLPPLPKPFHVLMTGHPVISLRGDDVVYLMSKESLRDDTAWVVAVDMRSKSLQEVVAFGGAGRSMGISRTCIQSRIPGHPMITSGNSILN